MLHIPIMGIGIYSITMQDIIEVEKQSADCLIVCLCVVH